MYGQQPVIGKVRVYLREGVEEVAMPTAPGKVIRAPDLGLNATFTKITAAPGNLALVSQSGAMCSAVLDWAKANQVGFSSVISIATRT